MSSPIQDTLTHVLSHSQNATTCPLAFAIHHHMSTCIRITLTPLPYKIHYHMSSQIRKHNHRYMLQILLLKHFCTDHNTTQISQPITFDNINIKYTWGPQGKPSGDPTLITYKVFQKVYILNKYNFHRFIYYKETMKKLVTHIN